MRRTPRFAAFAVLVASCAPPSSPEAPPRAAIVEAPPLAPPSAAPPAPAAAPPPTPLDELRERVLATSRAFDTVRSLTDEVGARLSGSPASAAAVAWAQRTLTERGLARVHTEPVKTPHWVRGEESGALVAPFPHALSLTALGGSVGTPKGGLEADVVEVDSLDALDALDRSKVEGKIVFFYVQTERTRDGSGYGKAVGVRGRGASRAAKLGAVGVVIRSIGTDHNRLPHTGAMRYTDDAPKIPAAALAIPDADRLHRILASGKPARLRLSLGARTLPDADGANVMGDVIGREAPGEIVLLGAHLDSWDVGQGAVDDGAGCAVIIEAARQIAALPRPPRRTIRVVLFANEENGLAGGNAYAKAHASELEDHVVALEADLGAGRVYEARYLGDPAARPAFLRAAAALAPLGVAVSDANADGGADLIPLRPAGVPIIDLRQDATAYFDVHHTHNDTLDKIDPRDLDQVAAAYATLAFAVADATDGFGRVPASLREPRH
jgi:hypothetical protein